MSIQSFLDSGLLESYILGQCTPEDKVLAEQMLRDHEEVRHERVLIEQALEQYAMAHAITPPHWMKGRILEQVKNAPRVAPPKPGGFWNGNGLSVLLGICALALGALLFRTRQQEQMVSQQLKVQELQLNDCAAREAEALRMQYQMAVLEHPDTKVAQLNWLAPNTPPQGLSVRTFYNATLAQTLIKTIKLPALGPNQDYQFWIFTDPNAAPVPLDTFQESNGWTAIRYQPGAVQFAVSLEPKGGSPNGKPTTVLMAGVPIG